MPATQSPESPEPTRSPDAADKLCAVCGDRALGYNFNAVTCESCKAFFRRNALSAKRLQCPFSDCCSITVITRRFCQKCRLAKCFGIGMRKEYIMSNEDKILKKQKIEQNRTKRSKPSTANATSTIGQPTESSCDGENDDERTAIPTKIKRDDISSGRATPEAHDEHRPVDVDVPQCDPVELQPHVISSSTGDLVSPAFAATSPTADVALDAALGEQPPQPSTTMPTLDSSASVIVDRLVGYPEDTSKLINNLMRTPHDAVAVMTKIIHSQKDAMRLIGHLIGSPGDALKIISKIMNSPFDALTVFTKFMSSPTDALEVIAKIASSPEEVLQFIQQLMHCPENALQIMHKFMNSPAEALKMLNKMVNNNSVDSTTTGQHQQSTPHPMIESMLNDSAVPTETSDSDHTTERTKCDRQHTGNAAPMRTSDMIRDILEEVNDEPSGANSLDSVICQAIGLEYDLEPMQLAGERAKSAPNGARRELTEIERAKLNELIVANKALYAPLDEDLLSGMDEVRSDARNPQDPQLLKIINLTAIAIRRLIKMAKRINAFRSMCQEDQVALLKGGCTELMILRSAMQYDSTHAKWQVNTKVPNSQEAMSSITIDVLKLAKGRLYEVYDSFIRTFESKWRHDENIILILSAIALFTSDRAHVVHADVLRLEQNSYYYLLRRYLESVYPGCEAKSTFLKLIQKIRDLQQLKDQFVDVYLDVNPNQVEPLLLEMFDLKNH